MRNNGPNQPAQAQAAAAVPAPVAQATEIAVIQRFVDGQLFQKDRYGQQIRRYDYFRRFNDGIIGALNTNIQSIGNPLMTQIQGAISVDTTKKNYKNIFYKVLSTVAVAVISVFTGGALSCLGSLIGRNTFAPLVAGNPTGTASITGGTTAPTLTNPSGTNISTGGNLQVGGTVDLDALQTSDSANPNYFATAYMTASQLSPQIMAPNAFLGGSITAFSGYLNNYITQLLSFDSADAGRGSASVAFPQGSSDAAIAANSAQTAAIISYLNYAGLLGINPTRQLASGQRTHVQTIIAPYVLGAVCTGGIMDDEPRWQQYQIRQNAGAGTEEQSFLAKRAFYPKIDAFFSKDLEDLVSRGSHNFKQLVVNLAVNTENNEKYGLGETVAGGSSTPWRKVMGIFRTQWGLSRNATLRGRWLAGLSMIHEFFQIRCGTPYPVFLVPGKVTPGQPTEIVKNTCDAIMDILEMASLYHDHYTDSAASDVYHGNLSNLGMRLNNHSPKKDNFLVRTLFGLKSIGIMMDRMEYTPGAGQDSLIDYLNWKELGAELKRRLTAAKSDPITKSKKINVYNEGGKKFLDAQVLGKSGGLREMFLQGGDISNWTQCFNAGNAGRATLGLDDWYVHADVVNQVNEILDAHLSQTAASFPGIPTITTDSDIIDQLAAIDPSLKSMIKEYQEINAKTDIVDGYGNAIKQNADWITQNQSRLDGIQTNATSIQKSAKTIKELGKLLKMLVSKVNKLDAATPIDPKWLTWLSQI